MSRAYRILGLFQWGRTGHVYVLKFKPAQGFCAQIHYDGNDQWVTSVCPEPSRILAYDSSISKRETITDSLKIQPEPTLLDKQQQRTSHRNYNSKSAAADKPCGLLGICSCIPHRILSYWNGVVIQLNIRYTADARHLCIEEGNLTPFPKRRSIKPPRRLSLNKDVKVEISKTCTSRRLW